MRIFGHLLAAIALTFGIAAPTFAGADKPLVIESAKIKQLPASTTLQVNASGTGAASINIPHGTAPTSPANGDCWTTTAGFYCQIAGSTVGPMSAGSTGTVTTTGSPASGNLAKFSGSSSITNGDLSGDVTTSGSLTTTIGASAVSLSKMVNLAANSIIGNNTGSAATPIALTATQATAMLNTVTSSLNGLAPASGGGTTNFLRADGIWAAPAGGGGGGGDLGAIWAYEEQPNGTPGGTGVASTWADRILTTTGVNSISSASRVTSTVTISIASPGVVTWTAHGLTAGSSVLFTTSGALPTGLTAGTIYYVVSPTTNTFQVAASPGGTAINTSGTQSGAHTAVTGQITLPAGTYDVWATTPFYTSSTNVGRSCRLYNATDGAALVLGEVQWVGGENRVALAGRFTLAATKNVSLQGIVTNTSVGGTSTLGVNAGITGVNNHFSNIMIHKVL